MLIHAAGNYSSLARTSAFISSWEILYSLTNKEVKDGLLLSNEASLRVNLTTWGEVP